MKLVCFLWFFCVFTHSIYARRIVFDSTNESESIFATWADFQIRHVISSDQGRAANWNAYFRQHMPSEYGSKSVNTFIVNSDSSIANNFPSGVPQYTGGSASNLYWSSTKQRIFVLTLSGPPGQPSPNYNVYDCGQKYYVAGLDMTTRLPVHYQGHSTTQGPRIDQTTAGCSKVDSHIGFCQLDESINARHTHCIAVIFSGTLFGLVVAAFVVVVLLKKCRSYRDRGNTAAKEYSPLIGNDGHNDGHRYV